MPGGPDIIRIFHKRSGELIAEGPPGYRGILSFEGNYYINRRCIKTDGLHISWIPGFCIYKFFYVWLNYRAPDGSVEPMLGWLYWLPNPLFVLIAFKPAVPKDSPSLRIESVTLP